MAAPGASEPCGRTRRSRREWWAVAAAAVALTACAPGAQVIELDDGVQLLVAAKADSGDAALLTGELTVLGGCVGLADTVVIWPHGTEVADGRELRITVPDLGTFALGDRVEIGGGVAVEPPARKAVEVSGVRVPAACAEHVVWMSAPAG